MKNLIYHVILIISLMIMTFFVIDIFNEAMEFMNNTATKILAFSLSVLSLAVSIKAIYDSKKQ